MRRKAGQHARGLMAGYVELRKEHPELFVGITLMQQPAAFLDGVIHQWRLEDLAERYGRSIFQRDTLRTHMTKQAHEAMATAWMLQSLIAGKMTPVLQLTDTDFAFLFKACCQAVKARVVTAQKAACKKEGKREEFKCTPYNVLYILQEGLKDLKLKTEERNLVLAGLRRNGMLAYRPTLKGLVRAAEEAWAENLPEDSHRLLEAWTIERYSWLDAEGVPCKPNCKGLGAAKKEAVSQEEHEQEEDSDEQQEEEEHEQEEEQHEEEQQEEEEQHTRRSSRRRRSMSRRRRRRRRMRRGSRRRTTRRGTSIMTRTYRTMYDFSISSGI